MSSKILLEKNKERENRKSEEKERRRRKKSSGRTPSTYVDFFGDSFWKEKDCLRGEVYFVCKVIKKSSFNTDKFFLPLRLTEI